MKNSFHSFFFWTVLGCLSFYSFSISAQKTAIDAVDAYFKAVSSNDFSADFFAPNAIISSIVFDSLGNSHLNSISVEEYKTEISKLHQDFEVEQHPMVLIMRNYANVVSIYCSHWLKLKDKQTGQLLTTKGIQSIKLVNDGTDWKIYQALIQNENPAFPIDDSMLPKELTEEFDFIESSAQFNDDSTNYDPNKVYRMTEVDEPPVYPDAKGYEDLLKNYDIVSVQTYGYTPFLITINEDGSAELSYAHDLSGYQITRAESFVRSMLVWYPAIKYAASVKCQQIFYIRD